MQTNNKNTSLKDENLPLTAITVDPFIIDDNGGGFGEPWAYYESQSWCTKIGNTYYIEDLTINAGVYGSNGKSYCIIIRDSSVPFVIRNSVFRNAEYDYSIYGGIYLYNVSNGNIRGNEIYGNEGNGIYLYNSDNNVIEKNFIHDNQNHNDLNDYEGNGIFLNNSDNNIINYNTCTLNQNNGIYLRESNNNLIENNTCNENDIGIEISISNILSINNNTCSHNNANGIRINTAIDFSISLNIIEMNGDWGLFLSNCHVNSLPHNIIWNNTIEANIYGIWMYDVKYTKLFENIITDNTAYGIFLSHDSSYNIIIDNKLSNNGLYCICYYNDCIDNVFNNPGCVPVNLNPGSGSQGDPSNPFFYSSSIIFIILFLAAISSLSFFGITKHKRMRRNGIEVDYRGAIIMRDGNNLYDLYESEKMKFTRPVEVKPYEFYCFKCEKKYIGHDVFCPTCGQRMKLFDSYHTFTHTEKTENNDKNKCILCYKSTCPICNAEINGENSCHEECPYCESVYHKHCWDKTIRSFGKCGFCLEVPPIELIPPDDYMKD